MSYLDVPRIHFSGHFQATPSTFNNTPNNYQSDRWPNTSQPNIPTDKIEMYWNPQGNGIFDLIDCSVTAVIGSNARPTVEALADQPVVAVYTKAPPKIVDLDPMQQNVSEVWGLMMQIGDPAGAFVRGTFKPIAFNAIWQNSQGKDTPRSSASGSGVYQSTLTNLVWQNPVGSGHSDVVATLKALAEKNVSKAYPEPRLSVNMVVSTHNNNPPSYLFNDATFSAMIAAGVPSDVTTKLRELSTFSMLVGQSAGLIPTSAYVNYLLKTLLGEQTAKLYFETILKTTAQQYHTVMPTEFGYGKIVGSIGPACMNEPDHAVPARMLAPVSGSTSYFAPAKLRPNGLTVDLGNSLPVKLPGRPPWAEKIGSLTLKCGTDFSHVIDYSGDLMTKQAGVVDIEIDPKSTTYQTISKTPLRLVGTPSGVTTDLLEENSSGFSMRADQFVFRMNPGEKTTPAYPRGNTARVVIHARAFGRVERTAGTNVEVSLMTPKESAKYTVNTLGTSGTKGITPDNIAVPPGAVQIEPTTATIGADGTAEFTITASDPGNPRGSVDGQVYFIRYQAPGVKGFTQDANDLVSIQIYDHLIAPNPTWENGVSEILPQFGQLYPVMGKFGLRDHDEVKKNAGMIRRVLELEFEQPLHMPATRDLSASRRKIIFDWMDAGMP